MAWGGIAPHLPRTRSRGAGHHRNLHTLTEDRLQIRCNLKAALPRNEQIDQRRVHSVLARQLNRPLTIAGRDDVITFTKKHNFDSVAQIRVIFDQ
jgi:hypothetical protein